MDKTFHSGFVTIVGKPNVGKSTLLNHMVGEKIAIISDKPQTTRNKITAILTKDDCQIIFMDTPGIHFPKNKLGEYMVKVAKESLEEVDVILFVVQADEPISNIEKSIINGFQGMGTPVILIINKIDLIKKDLILPLIDQYKELYPFDSIIPVSAVNNDGLDIIIERIKQHLPEGPRFFPDDMITDQPEKQIVAEIIREKTLHLLEKEVPHGIAVEIMSMKERKNKKIIDILANIYCEKDSHKAIIIGKKGDRLKKIGTLSRMDIERFLGTKVYMQLWVKVKKDWRNKDYYIKDFGYE